MRSSSRRRGNSRYACSLPRGALHGVDAEQRVVVLVVPVGARLADQRTAARPRDRARPGPVRQARADCILPAAVVNRLQPARHVQDVAQRDAGARVAPGRCVGEEVVAERCVERQLAVVDQHPDQRRRDALGRRPRPGPRRHVDARRVPFVDDLPVMDHEQAERHLLRRCPVERPVGRRPQRVPVDVGGQRMRRDLVAVRPGDGCRIARRRLQRELRQAVDVVEGLVWCEDHAADSLAERRPHARRTVPGADGHGPAALVDLVVAARGRPDGVRQERQLLREDLLQRAVRGEQPVAHQDRLLAVAHHPPLVLPVVVGLPLLRARPRTDQQHSTRQRRNQHVPHRSLHVSARTSPAILPPRLRPPPPAAVSGIVALTGAPVDTEA